MNTKGNQVMPAWFFYAVWAAVLYGLHQIFTKLAATKIGDGLGGFVVEATAAMTILLSLERETDSCLSEEILNENSVTRRVVLP